MRKGQMSLRIGLDERGEDLRMLPKVRQESITAPSSHDLHGFHGKAQEEVEKGGTNTNTVTLEGFQACQPGGRSEALDEGRLGEGVELVFVLVSKQVGVCRWGVDVKVILEGSIWVGGPRVGAPIDVLSFRAALVRGMCKMVTSRPSELRSMRRLAGVTWLAGEKASMRGTTNSPRRAAE